MIAPMRQTAAMTSPMTILRIGGLISLAEKAKKKNAAKLAAAATKAMGWTAGLKAA
jgi:hypothetical protein